MPGHHLSTLSASGGGLESAFQSLSGLGGQHGSHHHLGMANSLGFGGGASPASSSGAGAALGAALALGAGAGGPSGVSSLVAKALTPQTEQAFHYK